MNAEYGYGIFKMVFFYFDQMPIALMLVITRLNLAFRVRNYLYEPWHEISNNV